jgi:hypothetical protein
MTHYRQIGNGLLQGSDGQVYSMPMPYSSDSMVTRTHGLGAADDPRTPPQSHPVYMGPGLENDPRFDRFTKVPSWYVCSVLLDYPNGSIGADSVQLRPEPFILKRITWATNGDVTPNMDTGSVNTSGGSAQGRSVTVEWKDEFTNFMGSRACLISALFGDSQGYLDLQRGLLFQGKQSLGVQLVRLSYPATDNVDVNRFDFVFHGISLLPLGVNQSGSAG